MILNFLIKYLKWFYFFGILLTLISCVQSNKTSNDLFSENSVYIIYRTTNSKFGIISSDYNVTDESFTHVGLLLMTKGNSLVYHVMPDYNDSSGHLRIDKFEEFIDEKSQNLTEFRIFKLDDFDVGRVRLVLQNMVASDIRFDKKFDLNDDKFYCSEFVCHVLGNANDQFACKVYKKDNLIAIDRAFLNRDTLFYYPVDGLLINKDLNLKKIK
ncbi:permuted papain-like amidase YaeF/Yiix C92 family enzyme [Nonlabens xylanidelens]|uniref:Permuted papain-like amidase YaeF/Yiix C92 family enzyme n=1 Tax=Nonlabens xylanidelens TaxID=191564 RepID=A0A2S6IS54_9FLAO|nr:permuted papain-like amidase YaeF/Yiix C92 family enzyme [Nonlabens xylanidelens]